MRVEPEHVLEEDWMAAERRIENANLKDALHGDHEQRDCQYWSRQHEYDAGGVGRPNKNGKPEPGKSGGAHAVSCCYEIQSGDDRGKAGNQDTHSGGNDIS